MDGNVVKKEKMIRYANTPNTIFNIKLSYGNIISEAEFDRKWDRALKKVNTEIEKQHNIK